MRGKWRRSTIPGAKLASAVTNDSEFARLIGSNASSRYVNENVLDVIVLRTATGRARSTFKVKLALN